MSGGLRQYLMRFFTRWPVGPFRICHFSTLLRFLDCETRALRRFLRLFASKGGAL